MGVHRLFGNNLSVVKDASLTPSSVKTSSSIFVTEIKRTGSGTALLVGDFSGLDDSIFELRVVSGEGAGSITQSVFTGVGSGSLSGLGITGIANQDFVIQLSDLGIDTLNAEFDLGGIVLRALVTGTTGNNLSVSVNADELVFTETTFATFENIDEGTTEFIGPQWDWNTVVLNSKGEIPTDGMRLKFENDPQIYRQYKMRVSADWVYYLSPGAVHAIPAGSKIYEVTGHRRVTITNGVDVEQYTHVKTLYDFVSQIREYSAIVEVVGVIADDKTPGGMNCQDFVFVTDAYMHPIKMEGSKYVRRLDDIELQEASNTEILEIECVGNAEMGYEAWSISGSVTGSLPGGRTDEAYVYGPIHFKIPLALIDYQEPVGDMGLSINYTSRDEGEAEPPICLENRVLGVRAKTGSVTFTWTENVSLEGCECSSASLSGAVSASCLGLTDLGGSQADELDSEYRNRLDLIYNYISQFTTLNTYFLHILPEIKMVPACTEEAIEGATTYKLKYLTVVSFYNTIGCSGTPWGTNSYSQFESFSSLADAQARQVALEAASGQCWASGPNSRRDTFSDFEIKTHTAGPNIVCPGGFPGIPWSPETHLIGGAEKDLSFMHSATKIILATLALVYTSSEALVLLDSLWVEIKNDLNLLCGGGTYEEDTDEVRHIRDYSALYLERYKSKANIILLKVGIVPGGSYVSSCWNERSDEAYWKASGSYLPAYNNVVYHSVKLNAEGEVYSTKEFACTIVCACPEHLKVGDQVTVSFDSHGSQVNTYQLGDKFSIPIIAAKDLELSGGVDGNDTYTWKVDGSVLGQLPDYLSVDGAEIPYNQSGLQFLIERGGIPFELGDQWTFSVEGGTFRWRKDGGVWSGELNIGPLALSDGVSVMFMDGPAPSFSIGDTFNFKAIQPNSAEHIKCPTTERWTWIGSSGTLTIDCGGAVLVSEIFVADHNIPNTATILIEGSQDGFISTDWSLAMGWNENVLAKVLVAQVTVTHLRLVVTNADDCYIGWICAGVGLTTTLFPALSLSRKYASITGGSTLAGNSIPMGVGWSGQLSWENSISQSELLLLITLLDYLKENDNEPVILLPHTLHEEEGKICRVDAEAVEITDIFDYQPDDKAKRIQSVTVPLEPVYL